MKKYIGVQLVEATLATKYSGEGYKDFVYPDEWPISMEDCNRYVEPATSKESGYEVAYPNGYGAWVSKEVFEKAYLQVGDSNTIEEHNINEFIASYDVSQWGDKTTVVHATLVNGFIITESSSCVDPANFDMSIGEGICKEHIHNKLWSMLGFMLQTGLKGVK